MDILHIFYPPPPALFQVNTNTSLVKLVHICLCCKLDQQAIATGTSFGFKKDGGFQSRIIVVKYLYKGKAKI